jgi:hypothetical protein
MAAGRPPASRAAYLGKPAAAPPTSAHASLVCVSTPGHSGSFNFVDGYNDKAGIIIESDDDKYFALDSDNKLFPILPWDPNSTVGIPARIAITYKRARWSGINAPVLLVACCVSGAAPFRMHAVGRRPASALGILPRFRFVSRVASDHRSVGVTHTLAAFPRSSRRSFHVLAATLTRRAADDFVRVTPLWDGLNCARRSPASAAARAAPRPGGNSE